MKTYVFTLLTLAFTSHFSQAQLTNGSTAPDFTLTDINGTTHQLYDYLDAGKTVYLDFFAAHCPTCWNYKNTGRMADLYTLYGPGGTDELMVIAIELDANNGSNELYGISGWTQGDWVTSTPYPIINPEGNDRTSIVAAYAANYYPLIYGICPNRSIKVLGTATTANLYNYHTTDCAQLGLEENEEVPFFELQNETVHFVMNGSLTVADLSGRILVDAYTAIAGESLELSDYTTGIYILSFVHDGQIQTMKLLRP